MSGIHAVSDHIVPVMLRQVNMAVSKDDINHLVNVIVLEAFVEGPSFFINIVRLAS